MSLVGRKRTIEEGDTVFLFFGYGSVKAVQVKTGAIVNNEYGCFVLGDLVGRPFGTRLQSSGKRKDGWTAALHPTPELWTLALPHRTQILYVADISLIIQHLRVRPGSVVAECGTGSGSLSTSLARSLAPDGHLHTFDFNRERVQLASEEFARNGLGGLVTCRHRDVCGNGFPPIEGGVDAVFLDVPNPWVVVENCKSLVRPRGRICSFSPCIEQVQRTCAALREHCFSDVVTMECLVRNYNVRHAHAFEEPDMGDEDPSDVEEELNEAMEARRKAMAEKEAAAAAANEREEAAEEGGKEEGEEGAAVAGDKRQAAAAAPAAAASKRRRTDSEEQARARKRTLLMRRKAQQMPKKYRSAAVHVTALGATDLGHSGYLTFAVRPPDRMMEAVRAKNEAMEHAAENKRAERAAKREAAQAAGDEKAAAAAAAAAADE